MRRRAFLGVLVGTALGSPLLIRAQEKTKRIIGFLTGSPLPAANAPKTAFSAAFHSGLEEIGYVEGENLTVEYRTSAEVQIADNAEVIIVANGVRYDGHNAPPKAYRLCSSCSTFRFLLASSQASAGPAATSPGSAC